jgi:hypothetical protein
MKGNEVERKRRRDKGKEEREEKRGRRGREGGAKRARTCVGHGLPLLEESCILLG